MKKTNVYSCLSFIAAIATILISLYFYPQLPPKVPLHWNIYGTADHYGSKSMTLLLACLPLVIWLLMRASPKFDPRKESYRKHAKPYSIFKFVIVTFLSVSAVTTILSASGYNIDMAVIIKLAIALLFITLGNFMGQLRTNFFIGIRTPWTLTSEISWRKTHKAGGYVFIITGLSFLLSLWLKGASSFLVPLIVLITGVIFTFAYSYVVYRKNETSGK
ncbi:SdpI family protein [Paenactinomyces guangxiensis]|uniref:SdpI family protein n=1 Tax=Paenactinomyces guangxiensis TaxID=1490290 RepID=A0A7W1WU97_9BACL|nr:SdpI family protein [Paenactinomyces guangxiensis]MBA4496180.1 SdpI family protein [Paenactinomyces guangxiensis]MBH8593269.1 SdpI family protein [Paenactinomyces guangxiensis]